MFEYRAQLWALPEARALTPQELEARERAQDEPEEDAEEAQADAAAADKAEEGRMGTTPAPEVPRLLLWAIGQTPGQSLRTGGCSLLSTIRAGE